MIQRFEDCVRGKLYRVVSEVDRGSPNARVEEFTGVFLRVGDGIFSMGGNDDAVLGVFQRIGNEEARPRWPTMNLAPDEFVSAEEITAVELVGSLRVPRTGSDLAVLYGEVGGVQYEVGAAHEAAEQFQVALAVCEEVGDVAGIRSYLSSLHEVHRYLANIDESVEYAERLADLLDRLDVGAVKFDEGRLVGIIDGDFYRRRLRMMREGEPLSRVVVLMDGATLEVDDVTTPPKSGSVRFAFERNRQPLYHCTLLVEGGRQDASQGRYEDALRQFRQAAAVDPFDPNPRYSGALCFMDMNRPREAVAAYLATEALAPGWYHCRADLWIAKQLASGAMQHATYRLIRVLQDGPDPPKVKVAQARAEVEADPTWAPLWLHLGENLRRSRRRRRAEKAFRRGLDSVEDDDHRSRLLFGLASVTKNKDEARELYAAATTPGGNPTASAMARIALLNH